ncbi:MAG: MarR family transcriptional regulator [Bacteroidales bacterium]|nr:MarR family transcriptional regulator [Bacteroidales bacterium]MCF8339307.1 MarR family transcriptional regulator [Bacteroidales bacterium]
MQGLDNEIIIKMRQIVRSINLESKKIQKQYGVSIPQVLCLNFIKDNPNYQSTQREIRNYLNLNASTITGIINRLEKKGLIARLPKLGDKRVSNIALTADGQKLLEKLPPLLQDRLTEQLSELPYEKVSRIETSLDDLISLLNIKEVDASPVLTIEEKISDDQQ